MFIEVDRWVKLYDQDGEIVIKKELAIRIEPLVERKNNCINCQAEKKLGIDACCGCAG